jgi:hypothetical protein
MSYHDNHVNDLREQYHLDIMLISRLDGFEACRVGMRIIYKDAWVAAKPEITFVKFVRVIATIASM